ncbi:hypothetical protein EV1_040419 [Malus domestica]
MAVRLPHRGLLAGWLGLGPIRLPGWQQLLWSGLEFGPAVQQSLLLQWAGTLTLGLLWHLVWLEPPGRNPLVP